MFPLIDPKQELLAPSSISVWSQMFCYYYMKFLRELS